MTNLPTGLPTDLLHIDLRPSSDTHAILRYGWENLNRHVARPLPLAEIADLIALMERDYYGLLPENFVTTGQRLYRWLGGTLSCSFRSLTW